MPCAGASLGPMNCSPNPAPATPGSGPTRPDSRPLILLLEGQSEDYVVRNDIPNFGIHLRFNDLHVARVVRSLAGTTPPPGPNPARRQAWSGVEVQGQLELLTDDGLPPLSLIIDWHDFEGEPLIHVGLPIAPWDYKRSARLHRRVPLPNEEADLTSQVRWRR